MNIPTPHISAKLGDFAKTVIMPGDPLRAKFIADNFLESATLVTKVRGMCGYTGEYKGRKISVMPSGMGMPSMGIYSHELFNFYDVENIIRIGTAGAVNENLDLFDIVVSTSASHNSNFHSQYHLPGTFAPTASYSLLKTCDETAIEQDIKIHIGQTTCADAFYGEREEIPAWGTMGILATEMEAAALYMEAAASGKNSLCILSIADSMFKNVTTSSLEREQGLEKMIVLALETAIKV
jgi:purine-nucleoside phosphorylase